MTSTLLKLPKKKERKKENLLRMDVPQPFTKKLRFMTHELLLMWFIVGSYPYETPIPCLHLLYGFPWGPNKVTHLMGIYRYINICV
jgi:hypothetical protein